MQQFLLSPKIFYFFLFLTMNLLDFFLFFLVLYPIVGLPQGVTGDGLPIGALPSPPPCGWSFGFITEPLTVGLIPICLFLPALPTVMFSLSMFPTCPIVALHNSATILTSPEGSLICTYFPSFAISCA